MGAGAWGWGVGWEHGLGAGAEAACWGVGWEHGLGAGAGAEAAGPGMVLHGWGWG